MLMKSIDARKWWKEKGAKIINDQTINLIGQNIGYIPLENLLSREQLREIGKENLFELIDDMCNDGMRVKELIYKDGSRELHFFID